MQTRLNDEVQPSFFMNITFVFKVNSKLTKYNGTDKMRLPDR